MIYVLAPSIWGLIDLPWMSASIFQPTRLAVCSVPSYNTPSCEHPDAAVGVAETLIMR